MNTSKIIITIEDGRTDCELNDNKGHILDFNGLPEEEYAHAIHALNTTIHNLFLKYLKTK